jgi:Rps23 Pro-64 3,4-dihydroxylase Tpa1-like proline 4-hydroxylase
MTSINRSELGAHIFRRLAEEEKNLRRQWLESAPINYFVVDNLLPEISAATIRSAFPGSDTMTLKKSLRELKFVAAQMNNYDPLLEETVYAFQAPDIVKIVERITGLRALEPDEMLYAGGISLMAPGHFLNPHIDNSHDKFRNRYRVLNLLYYVSPNWSENDGGNLELWPDGRSGKPVTLTSKFNRLVVMVTHQGSWHSVSPIVSKFDRCCVSNYYFSEHPVGNDEYFHVTSFRGRPEQFARDAVLRADIWLRMMLRRFFRKGIKENPHFYKRK